MNLHNVLDVTIDRDANTIKLLFKQKPEDYVIIDIRDKSEVFRFLNIQTKEQEIVIELDQLLVGTDLFSTIILTYKGEKSFLTIL